MNLDEFKKAGGKLPNGKRITRTDKAEVRKYAMKIVGVLANASDQATRIQAINLAMKMVVRPYRELPDNGRAGGDGENEQTVSRD